MAKRALCMILALLTVMSAWVPAFAEEAPMETEVPEVTAVPEETAEPEETTVPEETAIPEVTAEPEVMPEPTAEPTATPEPIAEPTATPEPTAEPTAMPEPTAEPTATPEPPAEPTATPEPTAEPTAMPEPTAEPTATPEPTAEPTATPEPTAEPTATPEPTAEPTATPEPTAEPTATPEPTVEPTEVPEATEAPEDAPEVETVSEDEPEPLPVPEYTVENWQESIYNDGVRVSWKPVEGAKEYKIWCTNSKGGWYSPATRTQGTEYWFDSSTWDGQYYTYSVQCVDENGNEGVFDETGKTILFLGTPRNGFRWTDADKGIQFTWDAIENAQKYRIYYTVGDSGTWKVLKETTANSYLWKKAVSGKMYDFALQYVDKDGYTSAYNSSIYTKLYLARPKITSVKRGKNGATIQWNAVPGAKSYDVYYKQGRYYYEASYWDQLTGKTSFTWANADPNKVYYFYIEACENDDNSGAYSTFSEKGFLSPASASPKITSLNNVKNGIEIKWNTTIDGAAKYRVFYKTGKGGWKKLADVAGDSYTWKKAASGKTYSFTVRALTDEGKYASAFSQTGKSITHTDMPKISKAAWSGSKVKLSWAKVTGAAKYRVFYKAGDGNWKKLADTKSTSYTWTKAKSNTVYHFTVRCIDKAGKTYTSDFNDTGKLLAAKAPKLSSAECLENNAFVSWKQVTGAAKYQVFYKTGKGSWKKLAVTTSNYYLWSGPVSGKTYSFTVRAMNADGKYVSAYDKTGISLAYVAMPKVSTANQEDGVLISWDKVKGAAKYRVSYRAPGSSEWTKLTDTKSTSYLWTKAVDGAEYGFKVQCLNAKGKTIGDYGLRTSTYHKNEPEDQPGSGGSSGGGSSGGSSIDWDTGGNEKTCWRCGGSGELDCGVCGGSGWIEEYVSSPNYSGSTWGSSSGWERHRCPSCSNGSVTCSTCGGDGKIFSWT